MCKTALEQVFAEAGALIVLIIWQLRVHVCVCARVCACECARVGAVQAPLSRRVCESSRLSYSALACERAGYDIEFASACAVLSECA